MRIIFIVLGVIICAGIFSAPVNAEETNPWEAAIAKFEEADKAAFPAPGGVLFTGSSTIAMWNSLTEDFPQLPIVRRGFGGSQISDLVYFAQRIIIPYKPSMMVVYSGENDLTAGETPAEVFGDFQQLLTLIHTALPETRVVFISQKYSLSRLTHLPALTELNMKIARLALEDDWLTFIDINPVLLGDDGNPRGDLYLGDQLHLSREGYRVITKVITEALQQPRLMTPRQKELGRLRYTIAFADMLPRGEKLTLTLPIKNNSNVAMKFTAQWENIDADNCRISPLKVSYTILPGKEKVLKFSIRSGDKLYRAPKLHWTLLAEGETISANAPLSLRAANGYYFQQNAVPPKKVLLHSNQREQVTLYMRDAWQGVNDCSGSCWVKREEKGLRAHVSVRDDMLMAAGKSPWLNDSVEFYFDFRNPKSLDTDKTRPFQLIAVPNFSTTMPDTVHQYGYAAGKLTGIQMTSGNETVGYWIEIFLPFAELQKVHPLPGEDFAFDFGINDSDSENVLKSQIKNAEGISSLSTPWLWSRLRLWK